MYHLKDFISPTSCKTCNAHELLWKNIVSNKDDTKLGVTWLSCTLYAVSFATPRICSLTF